MDDRMPVADSVGPVDESLNREYRQILAQLRRRGFWLRLPGELEDAYCADHDQRAAVAFAGTMTYVFVLYLALGFSALALTQGQELGHWPLSFGVFLLFIFSGWLLTFSDILHRHYQPVVTVLAGSAVAAAVVHPNLLAALPIQFLVHEGTIFVVVVVYLALNLRLEYALMAGSLSGCAGLAAMWLMDVPADWYMSISTFGGGSALGFILCFREEKRSRTLYLQARLLELENQRMQGMADELERLSFVDGLTGVANRRYFDVMLERAWRTCQREQTVLTLMMLDVDEFKPYNDRYGHQKGDQCLRDVARVLASCAGRGQDVAARYGGEEFALLFPETDEASAALLADRVLSAVRELSIPHADSGVSDVVTVSAGVVTVRPGALLSPADAVAGADRALYQAKNAGRDNWQRGRVVGDASQAPRHHHL